MVSDEELQSLRQRYVDAVIATYPKDSPPLTWIELGFDPKADTISDFVRDPEVPTGIKISLVEIILAVGYLHAEDVLVGAPLPLNDVPDRRWQLRRELSRLVETMSLAQIQQTIYWAKSVSQ